MSRLCEELSLEHIDDWFAIGKAATARTVNRSTTGGHGWSLHTGPVPARIVGRGAATASARIDTEGYEDSETEYAAKYTEEEEQSIIQNDPNADAVASTSSAAKSSNIDDIELDSFGAGSDPEDEEKQAVSVRVYKNYPFKRSYDRSLVITKYREKILNTIESNQVTVIQGSTGSGKTTQVPQYILHHYTAMGRHCNIIVTQPRRIAAISIANRVCKEQDWHVGRLVGYQVGLEKVVSDDTRLAYVTTGVLLEKFVHGKTMTDYTHVILDEVHERDQDTDFALLVVRKLLRSNSRHVKVVLMSATFDCDMFAQYFSIPVEGHLEPAPVFNIEGKSFQVQEFYVEELRTIGTVPLPDPYEPKITDEAIDLTYKLIKEFDRMEMREQNVQAGRFAPQRDSVLIFMPGIFEIRRMDDILTSDPSLGYWVLPLHSTITGEEQARAFNKPKPGQRKIILSTNIAESSITVPDVKFVIDFCLTKSLVCDTETNYTSLQLEWASKANCVQRKGRAGRVSSGRVYRMVTRKFYESCLPEYGTPEMQRCPLEKLALKVKELDLGEPKAILGLALQPPNLSNIERTILLLKEVGALRLTSRNEFNAYDGDLTFLGRMLNYLPVDVRLGKLLFMGHVFGCLNECLIIALQQDWLWHMQFKPDGGRSRQQDEYNWCRSFMIQMKRLHDTEMLITELQKRLANFNIHPPSMPTSNYMASEDSLVLKMVLCGAFYPHYFINGELDEACVVKELSGKDPYKTVMIWGLPAEENILYKSPIEKLLRDCESPFKTHFEGSKAYIEFQSRDMPGRRLPEDNRRVSRINEAVYLAVKMKQLKMPGLLLEMLDKNVVKNALLEMGKQAENQRRSLQLGTNRVTAVTRNAAMGASGGGRDKQVALPKLSTSCVKLRPLHVVRCGHFWAAYDDDDTSSLLAAVQLGIGRVVDSLPLLQPVLLDMPCLAPYLDPSTDHVDYYRATIDKIVNAQHVLVFFVDYGNTEVVARNMLREMPADLRELPSQAMECILAEIQPSPVMCPNGEWNESSDTLFKQLLYGVVVFAKVYSVVNHVLRVHLVARLPNGTERSFNEELIKRKFACPVKESYLSEQNHKQREGVQSGLIKEVEDSEQDDWMTVSVSIDYHSAKKQPGSRVQLRGPHSPLEMKIHGMTTISKVRRVIVERDSVNSVLLDSEPNDSHARLIVAAGVGLSPSGTTITARNTSLLPNIHGLPALAALLFCPYAELRADRAKTRYTGALCGLGPDKRAAGNSLFSDHDIEICFDTHFDINDLVMIKLHSLGDQQPAD
ncbi:PREDICTED: putative ATP-dependent RNA helicase TDRD9, partial [Priapulus caudatus]|uniref:Probable ATP-dependent RNA helicase spindle-E n=1 Tax=Priapulus caudatus TaxID=37621 RepID=A0ABM1EK15_PRICU